MGWSRSRLRVLIPTRGSKITFTTCEVVSFPWDKRMVYSPGKTGGPPGSFASGLVGLGALGDRTPLRCNPQ